MDNFKHQALKKCVALVCQSIGFQGIYSMPLEVLTDLLHRYLKEVAVLTHRFAEHDNRTQPTLNDLSYTFNELKVSLPELEEYINSVDSLPFPDLLPKLPIARPSQLNLLKPGSKEVLSRPIHIHEHLPPMLSEKDDESKEGAAGAYGGSNDCEDDEQGAARGGGDHGSLPSSPSQAAAQHLNNGVKRGSDGDDEPHKRLRFDGCGEGEPVREIDSVIMTTSGFISSAREGKLPEPRLPDIPLPVLPNQSPAPRSSSGGGGNRSTANNAAASMASASTKKKMSLERLMRHKNNLAIKKAAQQALNGVGPGGGAGGSNSATGNTPKNKSSKKSLSHSAVLSMAGVSVDANKCFTTKHGKSKDKLKPKIPATPPGTSRILNPAVATAALYPSDSQQQQHFIGKGSSSIPKHSGGSSTGGTPLPPPKLKIPTPKMKQPEFSTDVLPLPKEDIQEQQERKLHIMKKEEKQKELARAAKNGLLGTLVSSTGMDAVRDGPVAGPPIGFPDSGGLQPPSSLLPRPSAIVGDPSISGTKKEKKDKDVKKESKKVNKDIRKDKDKRDKEKKDVKKEKGIKKNKIEKEKKDKEKKGEKKKEKVGKKIKDLTKKDKDPKKSIKEGKKSKDGKIKDKDSLKKDKKELKKNKKVHLPDGSSMKSSLKDSKDSSSAVSLDKRSYDPSFSNPAFTNAIASPTGSFVDVMATPEHNTSSLGLPSSPDAGKSKLCIFKKASKVKDTTPPLAPSNDVNKHTDTPDSSEFSSPFYNKLAEAAPLSMAEHSMNYVDMSGDLSGVISSPSIMETPTKASKPRKRKRGASHSLEAAPSNNPLNLTPPTPSGPKVKKMKHQRGNSSPRGRPPKGSVSIPPVKSNLELSTEQNLPPGNWDSRARTPDLAHLEGSSNKFNQDAMHSFGPLPPLDNHHHHQQGSHHHQHHHHYPSNLTHSSNNNSSTSGSFASRNMLGMEPYGVPSSMSFSDSMERPATPGQNLVPPATFLPPHSMSPASPMHLPPPPLTPQLPAEPRLLPHDVPMVLPRQQASCSSLPDVDNKKKKEKEHRKEKKEKEGKIKKKKDKKDKGAKVEKKVKDKLKKEKKKKKGLGTPATDTSPALFSMVGGPKGVGGTKAVGGSLDMAGSRAGMGGASDLQLLEAGRPSDHFPPPPPPPAMPATPKIVIKRSEPSNPSSVSSSFSVSSATAAPTQASVAAAPSLPKEDQPGSPPELAKISALITRPPKSQSSKKEKRGGGGGGGGGGGRDQHPIPPVHPQSLSSTAGGYQTSSVSSAGGMGSSMVHPPPTSAPPSSVKTADVMSIPSLKIKDVKSSSSSSSSGSSSRDRDYSSGRLGEQPPVLDSSSSSQQVVPPLKIKNSSTDDKAGASSKKVPPLVFGSSGTSSSGSGDPVSNRASKPSKKAPRDGAEDPTPDALSSLGHFVDDDGNEVWICPTCGKQDDGSAMIGCDNCDDWYHWVCVGIQVPPNEEENWYCPRCLAQHKQRNNLLSGSKKDKKKHHHKKKK